MLNDFSKVCQRGTFETRISKNAKDIRENVENSSYSASLSYLEGLKFKATDV